MRLRPRPLRPKRRLCQRPSRPKAEKVQIERGRRWGGPFFVMEEGGFDGGGRVASGRPATLPSGAVGNAAKARFPGPFRLDLADSRRYIRDTSRQAVSFACSERPAQAPSENASFLKALVRRSASTIEAQTLPLTATVRFD